MNVSDEELAALGDKVHVYTILPFNSDHARNYFANRLKDEKKQQKAVDRWCLICVEQLGNSAIR
jgi:hypothetical protein